MAKINIQYPPQLLQTLIPGLMMAISAGIEQLNQVRSSLGLPPDYRLVSDSDPAQAPAPPVALASDESRQKRSVAMKKAWAKKRLRSVSSKEIFEWARAHDGVFNLTAFKGANPGTHVRVVGALQANGYLKKGKEPKTWTVTTKAG